MMLSRSITLCFFCLLFMMVGYSCSTKNVTSPNDPMPSNLVDSWNLQTAMMGDAIIPITEVSNSKIADVIHITFYEDHTWTGEEYSGSTVVYTHTGTCTINSNKLTVTTTEVNGTPVTDEDAESVNFLVTGDVLTLSETIMIVDEEILAQSIFERM